MHPTFVYLGLPWVNGGNGPACFDCWGLVREIYSSLYGMKLPLMGVDADKLKDVCCAFMGSQEKDHWKNVQKPEEGDLVIFRQGKYPSHVGVWIDEDGGGVLHSARKCGVVFQKLKTMELQGWYVHEILRHKGRINGAFS